AAAVGGAIQSSGSVGPFGKHPWFRGSLIALGSVLFGVIFGLVVGFWLNCALDRSPPTCKPVAILALEERDFVLILRVFFAEFRFLDDPVGTKHEVTMTPARMAPLFHLDPTDRPVAVVREGFFGWPWVETILPAEPM
ncbi:MAG: hypothetical protein ACRDD1_10330, partial [Planctomycetia bacterium]